MLKDKLSGNSREANESTCLKDKRYQTHEKDNFMISSATDRDENIPLKTDRANCRT